MAIIIQSHKEGKFSIVFNYLLFTNCPPITFNLIKLRSYSIEMFFHKFIIIHLKIVKFSQQFNGYHHSETFKLLLQNIKHPLFSDGHNYDENNFEVCSHISSCFLCTPFVWSAYATIVKSLLSSCLSCRQVPKVFRTKNIFIWKLQ